MAELTYAELTQGRESTRLPHTHKFTSLKNVVILLCIKLTNEYIFKPKCNCRRKSMQEKESKMVVWCKLKVLSLKITVRHHTASLAMLNIYRRDRISIRSSQPLKILIIKKMCNVRTFVTHKYEIFFVHTYVTYENVIWPNLSYTQKYDI